MRVTVKSLTADVVHVRRQTADLIAVRKYGEESSIKNKINMIEGIGSSMFYLADASQMIEVAQSNIQSGIDYAGIKNLVEKAKNDISKVESYLSVFQGEYSRYSPLIKGYLDRINQILSQPDPAFSSSLRNGTMLSEINHNIMQVINVLAVAIDTITMNIWLDINKIKP